MSHPFGSFTKDASKVCFAATGQILSYEKRLKRLNILNHQIIIYNSPVCDCALGCVCFYSLLILDTGGECFHLFVL